MSETSSHFVAVCPNCLVTLSVSSSYSGNHVRCKHCDHKFRALAPDDLTTTSTSAEYPPVPPSADRPPVERMNVTCPGCSAFLSVRKTLAGQHIRCKNCDHKFLVEKIAELPVSPPAAVAGHDFFEHLYTTGEHAQSAQTTPAADNELAAIRTERDQLHVELATLQQQYSRIQSERDALQSEIDQLRRQSHEAPAETTGHDDLAETLAIREQELQKAQHQVDKLEQQVHQLDETLTGARADRAEADQRLREIEEELNRVQSQHEERAGRLRQRDEDLSARENDFSRLLSAQTEAEDRARELHGGQAQRDDELNRLREELAAAVADRAELAGRLEDLVGIHQTLKTDTSLTSQRDEELREAHEQIERLTQQVQDRDDALHSATEKYDQLQERFRSLEDELAQAHGQHLEATGRLSEHADELSARTEEIATLTSLHTKAEDQARQLQEGLAQRDQELRDARDQVERLMRQVQQLHEAVNSTQAERERLRELEDELAHAQARYEQATGKLGDHAIEISAKSDEIVRLTSLKADAENLAEQLRSALSQREEELGLSREQLDRLTQQAQERDDALRGSSEKGVQLEQRVRELEDDLTQAHDRHEQAIVKLSEHAGELSARGEELTRLTSLKADAETLAEQLHGGLAERDDEINRLREQIASAISTRSELEARLQKLLDVQETHEQESVLVAHRDEELREARAELERLQQLVLQLDEALNDSRRDRAEIDQRLRDLEEELTRTQTHNEVLTGQLHLRDDELSAKTGEINSLQAVLKETENPSQESRGPAVASTTPGPAPGKGIGGHVRVLWRQALGNVRKSGPVEQDEQINRLRQQHEEEMKGLREQLASTTAQQAALQCHLDELIAAQENGDSESRDALESERERLQSEFKSLAQAESARHAEELAEFRAQAIENAQLVDRLRAEMRTLADSRSQPDADLQAAREEIAELRRRLNERETTQQSMSSLLEGMGIRLH